MRSDGTNTAKAAVFEIVRSGVVKEDPIKMHDYTFTEVSQEEMCYAAAEFTYFSAQEEVLIHFNPMEKSNPNMQHASHRDIFCLGEPGRRSSACKTISGPTMPWRWSF